MEEFLKQNYFILTHSIEFLAAVIGLFCLRKYGHSAAKFLIYFLIYAFVVDVIGTYYPMYINYNNFLSFFKGTVFEKNYWWYIIFWFAGLTSFVTYVNHKVIGNSRYKKALKYCYYAYVFQFVLYAILNFRALFIPTEKFLTIICLWMISVAVILYLIDILQSVKITYFYKSIYFYINFAIFLWAIITGPLVFYEMYFVYEDWNFIILKWQIYLSINLIFYLTLSLALIFCKPETK